jgi:hypothetical protein
VRERVNREQGRKQGPNWLLSSPHKQEACGLASSPPAATVPYQVGSLAHWQISSSPGRQTALSVSALGGVSVLIAKNDEFHRLGVEVQVEAAEVAAVMGTPTRGRSSTSL